MLDIIEEYASVCKANPSHKQKETLDNYGKQEN